MESINRTPSTKQNPEPLQVEGSGEGDTAAAAPAEEQQESSAFQPFFTAFGAGNAQAGAWLARLLIVTALVYSRCLKGEFVYDDHEWANHRFVANWSFIWKSLVHDAWWFSNPDHSPASSYYRPFLDIWTALNFHLFGLAPFGWHAAMVVLYLIVVWQVFRVSVLLARDQWTGLLAAMLFALMPAHVESVAWPSAICQPLLAGFELAAFELYLRRREIHPPDDRLVRWLGWSLLSFAGALLTYESAVTFPLLIAAHTFIFQEGKSDGEAGGENPPVMESASSTLRDRVHAAVAAMSPYAIAVAVYFGVRFWVLGFISRSYPGNRTSALEVALTLPGALWRYLMILLLPWRAGPVHHMDIVQSAASLDFLLPMAGLIAVCAVSFTLLRNNSHRRLYLFCAAWFLIALAPMLNIGGLFLQAFIQDRYVFFPSFGFCLIAADMAAGFARGSESRERSVLIGALAVAAGYSVLLIQIEGLWHDDATLFSRCVTQTPLVEFCHNRMGLALASRGDYAGARGEFEQAAALVPDDGWNLYDLGLVYEHLGDRHTAAVKMAEGLKHAEDPSLDNFIRLAFVADTAGDANLANAALARAADMPGGAEAAALTQAQFRFRHGDNKGAEESARQLLSRDPNNAQALVTLGSALSVEHRYDEALAAYRRTVEISPDAPLIHYMLASTLHQLGRDREAHDECTIAIEAAPNDPNARALMSAIEHGGPVR
ncbi:MAG TPA: tetratricopeptide repeat protein [Candidatus Binataceae bacterium]|nr:tetratricopeptide repeat protein [Candidatus Binataceae bacterium]